MNDINVKIGGDTNGLKRKVSGLKKTFSKIGTWATAGLAVAVGAVAVLTKKLVELGDGFGKSAKRIGVSTDELQKLSFSARRSGASTSAMEKALKKMQLTIYDAGAGLKTYQDYLSDLGLTYDDLKGKSPEKQFDIIAERLNYVEDATTRAAIASKIFGRSGQQILPMIEDYKALGEELENINGIMSEESIQASEQLKDDLENLDVAVTALAANSGFIGWLSAVTGGLNDILKSGSKVKTFFGSLFKSMEEGKNIQSYINPVGWGLMGLKKIRGKGLFEDDNETGAITKKQEEAEQKKLEREKKLKKEVSQARENAKKREAEEKKLQEIAKQKAKELEKQKREEERLQAEKLKQNEIANDTINQIKHEIQMQELKNKGLDKELAIKEALYSAEKSIGRALTEQEKKNISDSTGKLYDLNNQQTESSRESIANRPQNQVLSDSLLRIGGAIGGNGQREAINLDKKRNDILGKLVKLSEKTESGPLGGEVML